MSNIFHFLIYNIYLLLIIDSPFSKSARYQYIASLIFFDFDLIVFIDRIFCSVYTVHCPVLGSNVTEVTHFVILLELFAIKENVIEITFDK